MDEKNEELVDAQIVEEDSRAYGHAEGEPGGEVVDEPMLVLGDVLRLSCPTVTAAPATSFAIRARRPLWR